jgi:CheY-like chemotaxis protein
MSESSNQPKAVTVSLDVVWKGSAGKQDARMSEISMAGCFIDCRVPGRALGDKVEFKVHLPSGLWVALQGELVHEEYPIGFELRFKGLTDEEKRLLAEVVVARGGDPGEFQSAPLEIQRASEVQLPSEIQLPSVPQAQPLPRRRVLVADDDALTLRMVSAIVETEGYQAVAVADGQQAFRVLQQDAAFSAVILDMRMPHLLGLDLIVYMKADERLRRIPIGMISAEQDPKVWDDSVTAGASVFLPKPFTPPQVQMMLRMLTNKSQTRQ